VHTDTYMFADCANIHWPYTGPVTGETAARFNWNLMNRADTSFLAERTGLSSVIKLEHLANTFPLDGYYECRVGLQQPYRFAGGWWNCRMDGAQVIQTNAGGQFDLDMNEFHSGYAGSFNFACLFGVIHNWYNGGPGDGAAFYQNGCGSTYAPGNTMHTTGLLIQTNQTVSPPLIRMRSYWDNNLVEDTSFYNPAPLGTEPWYIQRTYLQWNVTVGCNESNEGLPDCISMPITRVQDDGTGHVQIVVDGSSAPTHGLPLLVNPVYEISISGVGGATNANGIRIPAPATAGSTFSTSASCPITYGPSASTATASGTQHPTGST
jgi:hypothetical protein